MCKRSTLLRLALGAVAFESSTVSLIVHGAETPAPAAAAGTDTPPAATAPAAAPVAAGATAAAPVAADVTQPAAAGAVPVPAAGDALPIGTPAERNHKAFADALGYVAKRFQNYVKEHAAALQVQKGLLDSAKEGLRLAGPLMPTEARKEMEEKLKVQQTALEAAKQQRWVELQKYVNEVITQQVGGAGNNHEDFQSDAMAEAMRNLLETDSELKKIEDEHALFAKFWTLLVGDKLLAAAGQERDGDAKEKARKAAAERVMTKAAHKIKVFAPAGARQKFLLGPAPVLRERDAQPLEDWKADTIAQKFVDAFHIPEDGHTKADPTAFDTLKAALKQAVERAQRVSKEAAKVYKLWVAASKKQQGREGLNALEETARRGGQKAAVQMRMNKNFLAAATPANANGTADAPPGGAAAQTGDLDFPTALKRYLAAVRAQQDFTGTSEERVLTAEEVRLFLDEALSYAGEHQNAAIAAAWNELGEGQKQEIVEELVRESKAEYDRAQEAKGWPGWLILLVVVGCVLVVAVLLVVCCCCCCCSRRGGGAGAGEGGYLARGGVRRTDLFSDSFSDFSDDDGL
eukprot:g5741.t1